MLMIRRRLTEKRAGNQRIWGVLLVLLTTVTLGKVAPAQVRSRGGKKLPLQSTAVASPGTLRASIVSLGSNATVSGSSQNTQLELGRISYGGGTRVSGVAVKRTPDALVLSTRFGLLLQGAADQRFRTATVRAFVTDASSKKIYAIDRIRLTITPQTIGSAAPIGAVSTHELEITIPTGDAPGPMASDIGFLATPN
jgi:hypothetical protein